MEESIDMSEEFIEETEEEMRMIGRLADERIIEDLSVEDLKAAYCWYGQRILTKIEKVLEVTDGFVTEVTTDTVSRNILMLAEKRYFAERELARRGVACQTKVTIETKEDGNL